MKPNPPITQQIYDMVKRRPRTASELMSQIYWMHPQDAPQRETIKAHVWHLNQRLKGERIIGQRGHRIEMTYRLVTTVPAH